MSQIEAGRQLPSTETQVLPDSNLYSLIALTPMDGRYLKTAELLSPYLSEWGLMRARLFVESELLKEYSNQGLIDKLSKNETAYLDSLSEDFTLRDGLTVKQFEKKSDHDVVAIVNYMKQKLGQNGHQRLTELVHLGPTSEDIDNIAIRLGLMNAKDQVITLALDKVISTLNEMADDNRNSVMAGRTHGQIAGVTTFGKEMSVFVDRLEKETLNIREFQFSGKFNGIIGTFSGQRAAFMDKDIKWWVDFSKKFVESFGLKFILKTSQGNPNDDVATFFQNQQRINNILHGLSRDIWDYIKSKLLKQKITGSGSSTGAAKVNPWRAEHAEAMLEMANGMAGVLINNIQEYRLQRDLSDKTLLRFSGETLACGLNAWEYITRQLELVTPDLKSMENTAYEDWSFLSEAFQLILRNHGIEGAYEMIRQKTQGKAFSQIEWTEMIKQLIADLNLDPETDSNLIDTLNYLSPRIFAEDAIKLANINE